MATRAERAKAAGERSRQKRTTKKAGGRPEGPLKDATRVAEAKKSSSGNWSGGKTARRNVKSDDGQKATYALEDSATERPSRKSTRKSANRSKPDSQLRRREMRRDAAPKTRATKAQARGGAPAH